METHNSTNPTNQARTIYSLIIEEEASILHPYQFTFMEAVDRIHELLTFSDSDFETYLDNIISVGEIGALTHTINSTVERVTDEDGERDISDVGATVGALILLERLVHRALNAFKDIVMQAVDRLLEESEMTAGRFHFSTKIFEDFCNIMTGQSDVFNTYNIHLN